MVDTLVVFSGGPDSTAAAMWAVGAGFKVSLLTFQYRGREQYGEIRASMTVAAALKLPHTIIDFKSTMGSFSPLAHIMMHAGTQEGDFNSRTSHLMPFGAGMVLSIAANYALYNNIKRIVWGATKDDFHDGNYQYGKNFADDLAVLVSKATGTKFEIITPFHDMHKYEIMKEFFSDNEELFAETWSCKGTGQVQSGNCEASTARRISAELAGLRDETVYAHPELTWPTYLPRGVRGKDIDPVLLSRAAASPKDVNGS